MQTRARQPPARDAPLRRDGTPLATVHTLKRVQRGWCGFGNPPKKITDPAQTPTAGWGDLSAKIQLPNLGRLSQATHPHPCAPRWVSATSPQKLPSPAGHSLQAASEMWGSASASFQPVPQAVSGEKWQETLGARSERAFVWRPRCQDAGVPPRASPALHLPARGRHGGAGRRLPRGGTPLARSKRAGDTRGSPKWRGAWTPRDPAGPADANFPRATAQGGRGGGGSLRARVKLEHKRANDGERGGPARLLPRSSSLAPGRPAPPAAPGRPPRSPPGPGMRARAHPHARLLHQERARVARKQNDRGAHDSAQCIAAFLP